MIRSKILFAKPLFSVALWIILMGAGDVVAKKGCAWQLDRLHYVTPFHEDLGSVRMSQRFERTADSLRRNDLMHIKVVVDPERLLDQSLGGREPLEYLALGILHHCIRDDRISRGAVLVWQDHLHWGLALGNSISANPAWIEGTWQKRMIQDDLNSLGSFFIDLSDYKKLSTSVETPEHYRAHDLLSRKPKLDSEGNYRKHVIFQNYAGAIPPDSLTLDRSGDLKFQFWMSWWVLLGLQWGFMILVTIVQIKPISEELDPERRKALLEHCDQVLKQISPITLVLGLLFTGSILFYLGDTTQVGTGYCVGGMGLLLLGHIVIAVMTSKYLDRFQ